jgi:predicted aldo/keto reductase-like oxidoreductase
MNAAHWKILRDNDVFDFVEKAKASGRIKYIGFSFHDELPLFKEIIDAYDWDFCQIQYNFMDEYYQAGKEGLEYAASKGIGIVIMEPLRGGSIVRNIPEDINKLWKSSSKINTPADTALKFAWDNPAAGPVLSGMNTQQQLDENLESAENSTPGGLSEEERKILTEIKDTYTQRIVADCTSCRYCMPCASGVDIPANLASLNNISVYANLDPFRFSYVNFFAESKKAHNCTECGLCEEVCPQNIAIIDNLKKVTEIMAQ